MRSRFCLNTATIKTAPLKDQVRLTSAAGFRRIGLWADDIEATVSQGGSVADIASWINEVRLKVEELCFLGGWQEGGGETFDYVLRKTYEMCQVANARGCDTIVAVPAHASGKLPETPVRFRAICCAAAEHGCASLSSSRERPQR